MSELNGENVSDQVGQVPESGNVPAPVNTQPEFNRDDYVHKSRVNDLIHERTKEAATKAAEKARTEALASHSQNTGTGLGGMQSMSEDRLQSMLDAAIDKRTTANREEYERQSTQKRIADLASDFMGKIDSAKDKYPDLIKRQDEISDLASLVPYINEMSEVAGISQHLLDNEGAYASLSFLAQQSPGKVRQALKKIEASIKENEAATSREYPRAPLSSVTPSNNTMDNGSSSNIEALKQQSYLKG